MITNMTFVEFYVIGMHGEPIRLLGSDGTRQLDGRLSLHNQIVVCKELADRMKNIHKIIGFVIRKGSLYNSTVVVSRKAVWL